MSASYRSIAPSNEPSRFYDILFTGQDRPQPQSTPATEHITTEAAVLNLNDPDKRLLAEGLAFQLVQDRADIDISGPEFNFVRSIRLYDVRYAL